MESETQRFFNEKEQQVLEEILLHRRDVRGNHFKKDPIGEEDIDRILQAALAAPSVGFSQPWEFVIIYDEKTKKAIRSSFQKENEKAITQFSDEKQQKYLQLKLEGITESPLNIAVFYKPKKEPVLGQTSMPNMGKYSVVCAIQNMWLMARSLNIGMGWVSILDPKKVKDILNAPVDNQLIGYLCFGYTDKFYNKPELEIKKWDYKKFQQEVVIQEKY
ncbi:5,6-dimethylbenzimidazole synthase [Tenacibaculum sp. SZ-18]|uniref:5,6-dimethylbenzimidazole synthase n=1 Tax=Tenacibaculum sp. SZ-18 TaxID=754423 RepID=UPI000C2D367D|nr:5,6-dimethylbenzimidazole synthase [Tenacibaculum sp. SZ-18]AUC15492.1 5,6-dimethylbenzimidazole synthase [Tenacibaculum sp. SZ-18]